MFVHGSASLKLFPVVWIFLRSLGVICFTRWVLSMMLVLILQWLSLHWEILIMMSHFPLTFHQIHIAYDYSRADGDGLCDHLRDVPWEDVFNLGASAAAKEFSEWVQVGIDVYIPHRKYQVKPHSSLWFSDACAAAIAHRNHFFRFY